MVQYGGISIYIYIIYIFKYLHTNEISSDFPKTFAPKEAKESENPLKRLAFIHRRESIADVLGLFPNSQLILGVSQLVSTLGPQNHEK